MIHGLPAAPDRYDLHRSPSKTFRGNEQSQTGKAGDTDADTDEPRATDNSKEAIAAEPAENAEVIDKLKATDTEVRAHEAAHAAAGGTHITGGATFTYQTGPDGRRYAIGGEVSIDTSSVSGNPQATIAKMMMVRAAALAPANPSPQDIAVAAAASRMETEARARLAAQMEAMISESSPTAKTAAGLYASPRTSPGRLFDLVA